MLFQFSLLNGTKRLAERQIAISAVVSLSSPSVMHSRSMINTSIVNRVVRTFGTHVASSHGHPCVPVKRKRISIQKRLGSFTGFNPITGNTSELETTEPLVGALPKSSSDSLSVKMLRFENQFRILSKQQATIELNSILNFWYVKLPPYSDIPTTIPKSVKEMYEWVESMRPELEPNVSTYQTLLEAFLKRVEDMQIAEVILDEMLVALLKKRQEVMSSEPHRDIQMDDSLEATSVMYSFHKIMAIYGRNKNSIAAEQLLRKLEETSHEYNIPILSSETYSIAVTAWAKNGKPREAEYIIYSMLNVKDKTMKHTAMKVMPTKEMFDACLNAWVAYPSPNAGQRAELLVLKMLELSENGYNTKPNYKSYSKIVHAWVNSRNEYALKRVDKIMETMERMDWSNEEENYHITETIAQTYHAAMKLCSFGARSTFSLKKCVDYLTRLDKAIGLDNINHDTIQLVYAALVYTYAQSELPETEVRVQEIFTKVELRHKKYVEEKLAAKAGEEEDFDPYLSMYFYRALLQAFAKTGSGQKAEALLKRMMHEYLDLMDQLPSESNKLRKIDTNCFNSVLLAWSRSTEPDACHHAEKLFRQMYQSQSAKHMNVQVDVVSYNAVLSAMSGSTDADMARRGDTYFRQILESSDPKCRATAVTYTKAISLWSKIGSKEALKRADEILNEMITSKDHRMKPTKATYSAYKEALRNCIDLLPPADYQDRLREVNRMIKHL